MALSPFSNLALGSFVNELKYDRRTSSDNWREWYVNPSAEVCEFFGKNGPVHKVRFEKDVVHHNLGKSRISLDMVALFKESGGEHAMFHEPHKVGTLAFELSAPWYDAAHSRYDVPTISWVERDGRIVYASDGQFCDAFVEDANGRRGSLNGPNGPFGVREGLFSIEAYRLVLPVFQQDYSVPKPGEVLLKDDPRNTSDF